MSSPSMRMVPPAGSISLNNDSVSEDLPAPVLPTIPTFREEYKFYILYNI